MAFRTFIQRSAVFFTPSRMLSKLLPMDLPSLIMGEPGNTIRVREGGAKVACGGTRKNNMLMPFSR